MWPRPAELGTRPRSNCFSSGSSVHIFTFKCLASCAYTNNSHSPLPTIPTPIFSHMTIGAGSNRPRLHGTTLSRTPVTRIMTVISAYPYDSPTTGDTQSGLRTTARSLPHGRNVMSLSSQRCSNFYDESAHKLCTNVSRVKMMIWRFSLDGIKQGGHSTRLCWAYHAPPRFTSIPQPCPY